LIETPCNVTPLLINSVNDDLEQNPVPSLPDEDHPEYQNLVLPPQQEEQPDKEINSKPEEPSLPKSPREEYNTRSAIVSGPSPSTSHSPAVLTSIVTALPDVTTERETPELQSPLHVHLASTPTSGASKCKAVSDVTTERDTLTILSPSTGKKIVHTLRTNELKKSWTLNAQPGT